MAGLKSNTNPSPKIQQLSITGVPEVIREERSQSTQSVLSSFDSRDSISSTDDNSNQKEFPHFSKMSQVAKQSINCKDPDTTSQKPDDNESPSNLSTSEGKVTFINPNDDSVDEKQLRQEDSKVVISKSNANIHDSQSGKMSTTLGNEEMETKPSCMLTNSSPETVMNLSRKSGSSLKDGKNKLNSADDSSHCEASNYKVTTVGSVPNNEKNMSEDSDVQGVSVQHQGEKLTNTLHGGFPIKLNGINTKIDLMKQSTITSSSPPLAVSSSIPKPFVKTPVLQNNDTKTHQPFVKTKIPQTVLYKSTPQNEVTNQANQLKLTNQNQSSISMSNIQPIPSVAIVPGIKGAVVAKKGRFNVLEDSVIPPNHIITGNSISSQQGSVNIVGGMQKLPKASVSDHLPITTSVMKPHSKDSAQASIPRTGSPIVKPSSLSSASSESQQNSVNHVTQNIQMSSANTSNPIIQGQCNLMSSSSKSLSNSTATNNSVPRGATKIGRFILSSATNQPPNATVISTAIPSRNSPNLSEGQPLQGNISVVESSKTTPVQKQPNQAYQVKPHSPIKSEAHHLHNNVVLPQKATSMMCNPLKFQGQQNSNHHHASLVLPNPPPSSVLKGSGLSGAIPGGMGKMLHFLDQMRSEATEADKFIISMQKDLKFLREKNKELEMKWLEEKKAREIAEAKIKSLKKKIRETKLQPSMVALGELHEEDKSCDLLDVSSKPEIRMSQSGATTLCSMSACTDDEQMSDIRGTQKNSIKEHKQMENDTHSTSDDIIELNGKLTVREEVDKKYMRNQIEDNMLSSVPVFYSTVQSKPPKMVRRNSLDAQQGLILSFQSSPRENLTAVNDSNHIQELKTENVAKHVRSASNILRDFDPFQPSESLCIEHDNRIQKQLKKRNILESQSVPIFQNIDNGIRNHHHPHSTSSQSFQGISMDDSINRSRTAPLTLNNANGSSFDIT